jgi:uncharacterized protein YndB with AHSA1/START domain
MLNTPRSTPQFVVVRDIDAPQSVVFDVITSEAGMRAWIPLCRVVEWRHPPGRIAPVAGSVRYIVLAGGLIAAERLIDWDEGRELQYTFDRSSIPLGAVTTNYVGATRLEAQGASKTRLIWSIYFDTPGWQALLAPVLRFNLRGFVGLMANKVCKIAENKNAQTKKH